MVFETGFETRFYPQANTSPTLPTEHHSALPDGCSDGFAKCSCHEDVVCSVRGGFSQAVTGFSGYRLVKNHIKNQVKFLVNPPLALIKNQVKAS